MAKSISLQGNGPEVSGELVKNPDGVWSITVGPFAPDTYPYHFSVDKAKSGPHETGWRMAIDVILAELTK